MNPFKTRLSGVLTLLTALCWGALPGVAQAQSVRAADYIVAVVNNELVTQYEVEQRLARVREDAARNGGGARLPPEAVLRKQILDSLVDERVQVTYARDSGLRVEDAELDRAISNIASMNKLTVEQLRERLRADGTDIVRFRANVRDQMLAERSREREVNGRIRITEVEIDAFLDEQRAKQAADVQLNLAQILVSVPEGATPAQLSEREARVAQAQARLAAGESFEAVAKAMSEDSNRAKGGEIGLRPATRLPDLFVEAVQGLSPGQVTPQAVRSPAGYHLIKLLTRSGGNSGTVVQTRARHILLRASPRLTPEAASRRLAEFREQVQAGQKRFEELAMQFSEDGSAPKGGDLGWASPGMFVPEFEQAMNALGLNGISPPVVSRFGVHLIQVLERREVPQDPRQLREQARNVLRERKFDTAATEWLDELRSRAYIEMREPPL